MIMEYNFEFRSLFMMDMKERNNLKKFLFGILVSLVGLIFSSFSFMYAIMNPGIYNGTDGLLGSLICTDLLYPFIISIIVMLIGLFICGYESYRRK